MNTEPFSFDPEDPRLTAYALDELPDPAERAAVEQILERSSEARAALHEIRALTATLVAEYEGERAHASGGGDPTPGNVITMPPRAHPWPRRLLLAAAVLALTASVARLMIPSISKVAPAGHADRSLAPQSDAIARLDSAPPVQLPKDEVAAAPSSTPAFHESLAIQPLPVAPAAPAAELKPEAATPLSSLLADNSAPPVAAEGSVVTAAPVNVTRLIQRKEPSLSGAVAQAAVTAGNRSATFGIPADVGQVRAKAADKPELSLRRQLGVDVSSGEEEEAVTPVYPAPGVMPQPRGFNTAVYEHRAENPFLAAKDNPLSTFSIDVDTASYANVRRFIESGSLPPPDAVRIEEMVNYFPYNYAPPAPGDERPFAVHLEAASCPWNPQDRLVRIGIKGRELARDKRPASNLVFLLDVSGSMEPPERLPLIKASMRLLVEQLTPEDRVAIVTYAGESGIALPSTSGDKKDTILRVLDGLRAGGSTNGASGIKMAYRVAREGFIPGGTNRVILATDGDFNVGVTSQGDLVRMIEHEAKSGVALSALGVGTDNYKDATMQKLADKGNGNYHYIDKLDEARKVLVEQMSGTLVTIAKDVKIQVEFNPAAVAAYRLIGYEKRRLKKEDFNDDRVDAGEIGAGHCATAFYEVVPAGQPVPGSTPPVDALKYADTPAPVPTAAPVSSAGELLTVKIRHKAPDGDTSERSYEEALTDHGTPGDFAKASADFRFAAAVASFGMALQGSAHQNGATLGAALELAQQSASPDPGGYRAGFIELVRKARAIQGGRGE